MEDQAIIELYHRRDQEAITQTDRKYGPFCRGLSMNLLGVREDAEECVSDTYLAAWNRMPPDRPGSLRAYLGRICRNLSVSRFRRESARKRDRGLEVLLSELGECVPDAAAERAVESLALADAIDRWLATLSRPDRTLFVRRYWYGDPVKTLASALSEPSARTASRLRRLRKSLRRALEQEDAAL